MEEIDKLIEKRVKIAEETAIVKQQIEIIKKAYDTATKNKQTNGDDYYITFRQLKDFLEIK